MQSSKTGSSVKVWDLFIRVFHWALVAAFTIAYLTEGEILGLHVWAGYLVFSLVVLRLIWGVIGTEHARFSGFVRGPGAVLTHLREVVSGGGKRYLGHNPAGGAMIVALLICLALTSGLGLLMFGAIYPDSALGDLAALFGLHGEMGAESLEEVHEFFANLTLLLVGLHIAGVVVESLRHRENLIRPMVTGRKPS